MSANVIGHATVNVVPSTKGFGKALNGSLGPVGDAGGKSLGGKVGGAFRGVIGPLMAAAGAVGMGMFVSSAIKSAGALEQSMGAINSVFKSGAGGMHEWSSGAAMSVGLTRNEFNELGTLIGSQLKNAGTAMDELGPKTNELITLGADLSSMFGGSSREAVEALSSALKGERDPIEKYGVSLKQASIDAKAAELGFSKVGGTLSAEANAAATLALIMEQTTDAHGNFAREATTYEGVNQRLSASWGNITTTIGQGFLPFATAAGSVLLSMMPSVQGLADNFSVFGARMQEVFAEAGGGLPGIAAMFADVGSSIAAWVQGGGIQAAVSGFATLRDKLFAAVLGALPGILEALVAMAPSILQASVASFSSLVTGLLTSIPPLITTLLGLAPSLITTLLSMVPMILQAGLDLFTGIVQAVVEIVPQIVTALVTMLPELATSIVSMLPGIITAGLELFTGLVQAVIDLVPTLLQAILDLLPSLITTIVSMLPGILTAGITLFLGLVTAIIKALPQIITTVVSMLPRFVSTLVGMIPTLLSTGVTLFVSLAKAVVQALPQIVGAIITDVIPALVGALIDAVPQLLQAGIDLIGGLVAGLWDAAGQVGSALLDIIGGAVDGFLSFLGIHSPSRLMRGYGRNTGQGLALGLRDMRKGVGAEALGLANVASDALSSVSAGEVDGGLIGATDRAADGSHRGAKFTTIYNDHSTSQEDKQDKLRRAQTNLERSVGASGGSTWRK